MRVVIIAGGKGTRLSKLTKDEIPKPMVHIHGKPILQWQIEKLKENNISDIVIVVGYLKEAIINFFGDGKAFGLSIEYIEEIEPLGTAGALYFLKDKINDDFFLLFADLVFDIDFDRMYKFHKNKNAYATLFVHPNSHPFDSDLLILDENSRVIDFDSKHNKRDYWYDNCVNAGIYVVSKELLSDIDVLKKTDLEKDILFKKIHEQDIYGYMSTEYVKDVGTEERLRHTELDMINGVVSAKNLKKKQKCIFLDRDGTINKYKGLIYKEEDLELENCAVAAIKAINSSKYLAIVITNQPVVARGLCEIKDVENIQNKLKTLLGKEGAYLDDIFYCPHHPDKGYPEENKAYKIDCNCRKPKTGMIELAQERYNIDLEQSWCIGDTSVDIKTGENAGLKTILLKTGEAGKDRKYDVKPDYECENLLEAVNLILNK